jgi:hypothetical protein
VKPLDDSRIWLEKIVLASNNRLYGLGAINSVDIVTCSNLEKILQKDTLRLFYGSDFYPKDVASEVSNTTNLFYNVDSSRIIIAFNIIAKVVRLNKKAKKHEICVKMLQKWYYNYAYDMSGVIEDEPLELVSATFTGSLSTYSMIQKRYTFAKDVKPFSYWTGH